MFKFIKAISPLILLLLLLSGCAKKLPPQVSEGKAFSKQPYVVQGNIKYNVEEYRFGESIGNNPSTGGQLYASIKVKAQNIGTDEENLNQADFRFKADSKTSDLYKTIPKEFMESPLKPGSTKEGWLIFKIKQEPKVAKELLIKQAKIILE